MRTSFVCAESLACPLLDVDGAVASAAAAAKCASRLCKAAGALVDKLRGGAVQLADLAELTSRQALQAASERNGATDAAPCSTFPAVAAAKRTDPAIVSDSVVLAKRRPPLKQRPRYGMRQHGIARQLARSLAATTRPRIQPSLAPAALAAQSHAARALSSAATATASTSAPHADEAGTSSRAASTAGDGDSRVTTLTNGVRVATDPSPGHFVATGVYVDAGSRYESDRFRGCSHLLDRMSFKVRRSHSPLLPCDDKELKRCRICRARPTGRPSR